MEAEMQEDLESMELSEDTAVMSEGGIVTSEDGLMILGEKGCPAFKAETLND